MLASHAYARIGDTVGREHGKDKGEVGRESSLSPEMQQDYNNDNNYYHTGLSHLEKQQRLPVPDLHCAANSALLLTSRLYFGIGISIKYLWI